MLKVTERDNISPICPHCEKAINDIWYQELAGTMGRRYVYFCNHCHKVLGVSHRKGFWMG